MVFYGLLNSSNFVGSKFVRTRTYVHKGGKSVLNYYK